MPQIQEKIREQYSELFEINKKLLLIGEKAFSRFEHPNTNRCDVIMALIAKTTRSHMAVILLVKNGFGLESSNITRSMFEDCVNLKYIFKNDNESRAKRYIKHRSVQKFFLLDKVKNKRRFKKVFPIKEYAELKKEKEKFYKYYKKPDKFKWSGKSLKKLCKNVGFEQFYEIYYDVESHHPHAQPILMNKFIENITDDQQTFHAGPESDQQEGYLISAFNWMSEMLLIASIFFNNKEMQDELKDLHIGLEKIVAEKYI